MQGRVFIQLSSEPCRYVDYQSLPGELISDLTNMRTIDCSCTHREQCTSGRIGGKA